MNIQDFIAVYGPKTPLIFSTGGWDFSNLGERLINLIPDVTIFLPH